MSYSTIDRSSDAAIAESYLDILSRKEFFSLRNDDTAQHTPTSVDEVDLSFRGKHLQLHSHQMFVRNMMNPNTPYKRLLAKHSTGSGKCLGKDTPVMLYNGKTKMVQNVQVGDTLMGDDSLPRVVQSVCTGREQMYEVSYKYGSFTCNASHILTLRTDRAVIDSHGIYKPHMQTTVDMCISDYLAIPTPEIYAFRSKVEFSPIKYLIPPYIMGLWCAWGLRSGCVAFTDELFADFVEWASGRAANFGISDDVMNAVSVRDLKSVFVLSPVIPRIPGIIMRGSSMQRMEVLAGILDGLSTYTDLITRTKTLHYRIRCPAYLNGVADKSQHIFGKELSQLIWSLGYVIQFGTAITIRGDFLWNIPVVNEHLKIPARFQKNDLKDPQLLDMKITPIGEDNYYGFEISGNGRFLLGDYMTTHNTILALSVANTFIDNYKQRYEMAKIRLRVDKRAVAELDRETPSIFIIGFNHSVFYRTLMEFPEFGYVSVEEKERLDQLRAAASAGMEVDIKRASDYYSSLVRVIKDKRKGGFFKFYGYQMLVNRLFISDDLDLTDIDTLAKTADRAAKAKSGKLNDKKSGKLSGDKLNDDKLNDDDKLSDKLNDELSDEATSTQSNLLAVITKYIEEGKIQINHTFLNQFKDSLLICDEIHNVYNSSQKNNWGVAIQYLLDYHENLRALFLSATPINNSPTEIIDVLNLLLPANQKVQKTDFFANNRDLRPGKLDEIGRLTAGRISFLEDINPKYYPKRIFVGDTITLPRTINGFKSLPYLKFTSCEMSPLHFATYNNMLDGGMLYSDGYAISDMVFPNPNSTTIGLYRSGMTRNKIMNADAKWGDKVGIKVVKHSALNVVFRGNFLNIANIKKYSTKYFRLITDILAIARSTSKANEAQKIMIYHSRVKMSGVLMIQELLLENGFIGADSEPSDNTLCSICGKIKKGHSKAVGKSHDYMPARFIMAHGDMDKNLLDGNIAKFNASDNANGLQYKIIVGSRQIKESYEIWAVRHLMIMALPDNIPSLMQIFGRTIRKNSHADLPPSQRDVSIHIYVSTIPAKKGGDNVSDLESNSDNHASHSDSDSERSISIIGSAERADLKLYREISYEVYAYFKKLQDYLIVQDIEKTTHEYAIDAEIHRDTIMTEAVLTKYFPNNKKTEPTADIGALYYDPKFTLKPEELSLTSFNAYGYGREEVEIISSVIKRLFINTPAFTYDELWKNTQHPPFQTPTDSSLFSEGNFAIALTHLVEQPVSIYDKHKNKILNKDERKLTEAQFIAALFDYNDIYILKNNTRHLITQVGEYYILLPVDESNDVIADIDSFIRADTYSSTISIDVEAYIVGSKSAYNYEAKKDHFYYKYCKTEDMTGFLTEYDARFYFNLLDEIIIYRMTADTKKINMVNKKTEVLYHHIIEELEPFGMIIFLRDIKRMPKIARLMRGGINNKLPAKTPVGYIKANSVKLFDNEDWIEVSRGAMNRPQPNKENRHIIGYFDPMTDGKMKFKLRKPISKLNIDRSDIRTVETGMVCETKNKRDLLNIAKDLNIRNFNPTKVKIRELCMLIQEKLLDLEVNERQKNTSVKYVYLFNENQPTLR